MKRHHALEPFSRDHYSGLRLARDLLEDRPNSIARVRQAWEIELQDHFAEEERCLAPLAPPELADRLRREHAEIAAGITRLPEGRSDLGQALHDHIRWEEREFFPAVEAAATAEELDCLARESYRMEERRWPHSPHRRRLVQRRPPPPDP